MHKSTLLFHFKILKESQFEDFRIFLSSDYFNPGPLRENVVALFDYIMSVYPDFSNDALLRENVHASLFPGKEFLKGRLDKVMHEMNRILKEYLLWARYKSEENEFNRNLEWVEIIRSTGDEIKYQLANEKLKSEENQQKLSLEHLLHTYQIENEAHEWSGANYNGKDDTNLFKTIASFYEYSLAQEFEHINSLLVTTKVSKIEIPEQLMQRINTILADTQNTENNLLKSYQKTLQILIKPTPEEADFWDFMDFLNKIEDTLSIESLKYFYTHLRNFCTSCFNNGAENMRPVLHEIHKQSLNRGYFYFYGKIYPNTILTITRIALSTNNFQWVSDLLKIHKNLIIGELPDGEYYNSILAMYQFATGRFEDALKSLPINTLKNVNYQITNKLTEIKCFYELGSELVIFKLEAFKVYLSRNTQKVLSLEQQQGYTKFVSAMYQVIQCTKGDSKKIIKILKKLNEPGTIQDRTWLLSKIEALE